MLARLRLATLLMSGACLLPACAADSNPDAAEAESDLSSTDARAILAMTCGSGGGVLQNGQTTTEFLSDKDTCISKTARTINPVEPRYASARYEALEGEVLTVVAHADSASLSLKVLDMRAGNAPVEVASVGGFETVTATTGPLGQGSYMVVYKIANRTNFTVRTSLSTSGTGPLDTAPFTPIARFVGNGPARRRIAFVQGANISVVRRWGGPLIGSLASSADVASDGTAVCGLGADGKVSCVGEGYSFGALPQAPSAPPVIMETGAVRVAAGLRGIVVQKADGTLRGAGDFANPAPFGLPPSALWVVDLPPVANIVDLAVGAGHMCVIDKNAEVRCRGSNRSGESDPANPGMSAGGWRRVAGVQARALALGQGHSCALTTAGMVSCWGSRHDIQSVSRSPVTDMGLTGITQLRAGYDATCARKATGEVFCWGSNERGQLGNASETTSTKPVKVFGVRQATDLAVGDRHACAILSGGRAVCWGDNMDGSLGLPATVQMPWSWTPRPVRK